MTRKEWAGHSYAMQPGQAYENRADYEYDHWGRLTKVTQVDRSGVSLGTPEATSYTYNLLGGLDKTINANGLIQEND